MSIYWLYTFMWPFHEYSWQSNQSQGDQNIQYPTFCELSHCTPSHAELDSIFFLPEQLLAPSSTIIIPFLTLSSPVIGLSAQFPECPSNIPGYLSLQATGFDVPSFETLFHVAIAMAASLNLFRTWLKCHLFRVLPQLPSLVSKLCPSHCSILFTIFYHFWL
jgi:hypothetical protein